MKIDLSKKYTTRDGRPVEFLHRAPEGWPDDLPWRGIAGGVVETWGEDGRAYAPTVESPDDIIEVREPLEVLIVVNAKNRHVAFGGNAAAWDHASPEHAPHRIATFREVIP